MLYEKFLFTFITVIENESKFLEFQIFLNILLNFSNIKLKPNLFVNENLKLEINICLLKRLGRLRSLKTALKEIRTQLQFHAIFNKEWLLLILSLEKISDPKWILSSLIIFKAYLHHWTIENKYYSVFYNLRGVVFSCTRIPLFISKYIKHFRNSNNDI